MFVCICNGIKERDVREAARGGATCPSSAYAQVGCKPRCGQCFPYARQVIASEQTMASPSARCS